MIGSRLGQYEIVEEIGRGGMGTVYRARQVSLNRDVALKLLTDEKALDADALHRFQREGLSLARLAHPNIVQILEVGEDQGRHFIAMELIEGRPVSQVIEEDGPLPYLDAVALTAQVASALGAIHAGDLVHRDVKPSNILVGPEGRAKLTDFGVAALTDQPEGDRLTMAGAAVGTPHYMSPEQIKARDTLTGASDVYSLGVVLHEMLTGNHPFGDATPTEAMVRQCSDDFPPIRRFRPDIPDPLEAVLQRCLAKDPAARFPDGNALHKELDKIRLQMEVNNLQADGEKEDDYRKRVSGTGFFYVDPATRNEAGRRDGLRAAGLELAARIVDPYRGRRRALARLYNRATAARTRYKDEEARLEKLRERQAYHEKKVSAAREQGTKHITAGLAEEAEHSAELEARHERLAQDYAHQATEAGNQIEALRHAYDGLKEQHTREADELALSDAEARRRGHLVPTTQAAPALAKHVRILAAALIVLCSGVVLLAAGALTAKFGRGPRPETGSAMARPPLVRPLVAAPRPAPAAAPRDGLLLHYTFDEDEGETVTDQSGMGHHGKIHGAQWTRTENQGGALSFDGDRDYVDIGTPPALKLQRNFTLIARLATDRATAGAILAQSYGNAKVRALEWHMENGHLGAYFWGSGGFMCATTPYPAGSPPQWHYVALQHDGSRPSRQMRLYIDGVEFPAKIRDGIDSIPTIRAVSETIKVGSIRPGFHDFVGKIDDIKIFDRVLSPSEVAKLCEAAPPVTTQVREGTSIMFVDAHSPGSPKNGSATQPYQSITDAIAAVKGGTADEVLTIRVAPGTYTEDIIIYKKPHVHMEGGWVNENGRWSRPDPLRRDTAVLGYRLEVAESPGFSLDGFTVTSLRKIPGYDQPFERGYGQILVCEGSHSASITRNRITQSLVQFKAPGALQVSRSDGLTIANNEITTTVDHTNGICTEHSQRMRILFNTLRCGAGRRFFNIAVELLRDSTAVIANNSIYATGAYAGGSRAIRLTEGSSADIINNTVYSQATPGPGYHAAAIELRDLLADPPTRIINNVLVMHRGIDSVDEIAIRLMSPVPPAAISYNCFQGVQSGALVLLQVWQDAEWRYIRDMDELIALPSLSRADVDGNVVSDPRLAGPPNDLRLTADSPCIDAGLTSAGSVSTTDLWGNARREGKRTDIGAHEYVAE